MLVPGLGDRAVFVSDVWCTDFLYVVSTDPRPHQRLHPAVSIARCTLRNTGECPTERTTRVESTPPHQISIHGPV